MTRRLLTPATLLTAAALVGAGCGGGGSDKSAAVEAKAAYRPVGVQIGFLIHETGPSIALAREADSDPSFQFTALGHRGRVAIARLDALDVPDDLKAKRQALSDALAQGTGDMADITRAARASDTAAVRRAAEQLNADLQKMEQASAAFEQALNDAAK